MHALDARDITARRDNAPFAAPDNDRLVFEFGVIALLNAGVKRIAINMRDREAVEFGV